ncbi:MAG: hypothetical protein WCX86_09120 [Candidatus Hydrogenedentales bacterium]
MFTKWFPLILICCFSFYVSAEMSEEQQTKLIQTWTEMNQNILGAESEVLHEYLTQEILDSESRQSLFDLFFKDHAFTINLGYNLEYHIFYSSIDQNKMVRFAASMAASALKQYWEAAQAHQQKECMALPFLETIFNKSNDTIRTSITEGINDTLKEQPLDLNPYLSIGSDYAVEAKREAIQSCITLGVFLTAGESVNWLQLPKATAEVFEHTGVWLFDGALLSEEHIDTLKSLFGAIPMSVHGVVALYLLEFTGVTSKELALRVPGTMLNIPFINMEVLRETIGVSDSPLIKTIPEFTAMLLEHLSAVVHTRQYQLRPDLYQRIYRFFSLMKIIPDPMLPSLFPQHFHLVTPEERMNYLGYLWLLNSHYLLEWGITEVELMQARPLMFTLLLEADVWSGLEDTTSLFLANTEGKLLLEKTALRRTGPPGSMYVNGIAFSGRIYQYDMEDLAGYFHD